MNLLQQYKNWTYNLNKRYTSDYDEYFQPYFKWNPFDDRNDWQPEWVRECVYGWIGVGYAFEAYTYLMRDKKYSYPLPNAFWLEINGNR
jgi:hypothetical protein